MSQCQRHLSCDLRPHSQVLSHSIIPRKALLEADVHARAGLCARAHRPRAALRRPRLRRVLTGDRARLPRPERRRRPETRHGELVRFIFPFLPSFLRVQSCRMQMLVALWHCPKTGARLRDLVRPSGQSGPGSVITQPRACLIVTIPVVLWVSERGRPAYSVKKLSGRKRNLWSHDRICVSHAAWADTHHTWRGMARPSFKTARRRT